MKKLKVYMLIGIMLGIIILGTKTQAAGSISLSASKSTVTIGEEFNISVNLNGASVATLTTRIAIDTSKVDYVSGPSNSNYINGRIIYTWTDPTGGDNPKTGGTIATFKLRAKAAGKANFSVSGDFYDANEKPVNPNFSGVNVMLQEKAVTPPNSGGDSTGGSSNSGTTTNPSKPNNSGSSGTGSTTKPENKPNNTTSNTTTPSKNANLKGLHLGVEGMTPNFNKNVTEYYLVIDNTVDIIQVIAETEEEQATTQITGNTNLQIGTNTIQILVTAPDKVSKKNYVVHVTKTEHPDLANANLETLAIENVMLEPSFTPENTEYTATLPNSQENIHILAIPQIEGANVTIEGQDSIQVGDNEITILVMAKDGVTTKEYKIQLHRKTLEEEQMEIETEPKEDEQTNDVVGKIIFSMIVIAGVGGLSYYLIRKYQIEQNKK